MNELKRFENDLKDSEELQRKLEDTCRRLAAESGAGSDGEIMAAAVRELGYDVSIADLEKAKAEAETVDPDALRGIAGGFGDLTDGDRHEAWCLTLWHCFTLTLHTEPSDKKEVTTCWSDYRCVLNNNP